MEKDQDKKNFQVSVLVGFIKKQVLNLKTLNKVLFASMIVLGIFYIAGTNDLSIQGFALSDLKAERNKLSDENKKLELKAMTLSSYNVISGKIENLKMVAVGEIDYINGSYDVVAKK
ncbi:MAG: hypothetical protein Q7K35_04950 [bacterium]|nr:hypothetical protein [bacterium]